jgi:protein-disulfide isomerase
MALRPSLRPFLIAGASNAPHTLDIFLDYVCPFSAKMARAIENVLKPKFAPQGEYGEGKVKVIIRLQVQPWHGASTFTHEAALAVARVSPENFWPFSLALFENQGQYFDIPTSTLTPIQIREKLAQLAANYIPSNKVDEFKELLKLKSSPNGGVAVTDDLKYTIKFSRQNGIHVSPTVLWDGLVAGDISSGWGEAEWTKFLKESVA